MIFISLFTLGCRSTRPDSSLQPVLFNIDENPVYSEEFLYNFKKNLNDSDSLIETKDINEYLNLFINFKLKVKEATTQGLDTTQEFLNEFNKYKDQLTESYLKDDSILITLVKEAYNRMQYEINVSHIMIRVQNEYDPIDTMQAYEAIINVYKELESGADFQKMAILYSQDPSVKMNHGNLGYFTALQMVYPFENMAYHTPVGQYSKPFKTSFGYHILKVNDIRPAQGKIQVAHIMLRFPDHSSQTDSAEVKDKIFQIYDSINNGGIWEVLCRQYSEDENTKNSKGVLKPFETGRVIPAFSEAAFRLKKPEDISEPVLTPYGWHIIKLINKIPIQTYEEIKDELTERVKRDSRSGLSHTYLIKKLKEENNFHLVDNVWDECIKSADSILLSVNWIPDSSQDLLHSPLFTIKGKEYPVMDFIGYVHLKKGNRQGKPSEVYLKLLRDDLIEEKLIEFEKAHLEEKYYDYKMLVNEYYEGILLFNLMDKEVWNRAINDTLGLNSYFKLNKNNYRWPERADAMIFSTSSAEEIEMVRNMLNQPTYTVAEDKLEIRLEDNGYLDNESGTMINNLLEQVGNDTTLYLEVSCNTKTKEVLQSYLDSENQKNDRILYNNNTGDEVYLKLVSSSKKYLKKIINENTNLNLQVESGLYEKGDHEIMDLIDWRPGKHDLSIENVEYLVYVVSIIPPASKDLSEVRGQVISDYQDFLEREWIKELKGKYSVNVNDNALLKIYKEFGIH